MLIYRRRAYQPAAPVAADDGEFIGKFAPEHGVCVFNIALGKRVSYPRRAYRRAVIVGALRHGAQNSMRPAELFEVTGIRGGALCEAVIISAAYRARVQLAYQNIVDELLRRHIGDAPERYLFDGYAKAFEHFVARLRGHQLRRSSRADNFQRVLVKDEGARLEAVFFKRESEVEHSPVTPMESVKAAQSNRSALCHSCLPFQITCL